MQITSLAKRTPNKHPGYKLEIPGILDFQLTGLDVQVEVSNIAWAQDDDSSDGESSVAGDVSSLETLAEHESSVAAWS